MEIDPRMKLASALGLIALRMDIKGLERMGLEESHRRFTAGDVPFNDISDSSRAEMLYAAKEDIERWEGEGIATVGCSSAEYPARLRAVYEPPPVLFIRGEKAALETMRTYIAVVGSRKADLFGCELATRAGKLVAKGGGCVVSGLAFGIDAAAHRGALDGATCGAPTVAILGHGLRHIYPNANRPLALRILERGGALVSQFEPQVPAYPANFLARNRIIAGISDGVLLLQAPARSGALVTARFSIEEGREVITAPGAINDPRYEGSNRILQQGAHVFLSEDDLFTVFPLLDRPARDAKETRCSESQQNILSIITQSGPMHVDELARKASGHDLINDLLELELAGKILRLPGNYLQSA